MVDRQFSNGAPVAIIASPTPEPKWITSEDTTSTKKMLHLDGRKSIVDALVLWFAELSGTALLVFLGCLACDKEIAGDATGEHISFTFGLAILISVQIFGHISGSHINPAVTVAAITMGHIGWIEVPIYITGQLLGGIAGIGLVKAVTPSESIGICSPNPNVKLTSLQVLLVEFLLTLLLVWVCCGLWDSRTSHRTDSTPLRLGFTVAGLSLAGGPYSGAHLNPARSFGPALINGDWNYQWIYWLGPISAGFLGGLVYRIIFLKNLPNEESHEGQVAPDET